MIKTLNSQLKVSREFKWNVPWDLGTEDDCPLYAYIEVKFH